MEIGPILRATSRNKVGATLIALQIAFTMTVVVNAWTMIEERLERMGRASGVVEDELFHITTRGFTTNYNPRASVIDDLDLLRRMPGIVDAVPVNTVPMSDSGWSMGLRTQVGEDAESAPVGVYMVDDHGVSTFGVELVAGRDFAPEDVRERGRGVSDWPDTVLISAATAEALWPDDDPLEVVGRTVYIAADEPMTVIGVYARLQVPWNNWPSFLQSMMVPDKVVWNSARYLIRTEPGRRDEMMPVVEEALASANPNRLVRAPESMADTRRQGYLIDSGLATILTVVMVALLIVTSLGVVGLAAFNVRRRVRQIGTRRALGARKWDVVRYFLVENFVITSIGVLLGAVLTVASNIALAQSLGFPKIDWTDVPVGMVVLWLVGLLAVLGPAQRASAVAPAVATRTV